MLILKREDIAIRMNTRIIFLLFFTLTLISAASAGNSSLLISDVSFRDGLMSVIFTPDSGKSENPDIYALYIMSDSLCTYARFLGWTPAPLPGETAILITPWPSSLSPGQYQVILAPMGSVLKTPCSDDTTRPFPVNIPDISDDGDGLSGIVSGMTTATGPDYQITSLEIQNKNSRIHPGETTTLEGIIRNNGTDDLTGLPISVHAYLARQQLLPATGILLSPLKSGEKMPFTATYHLPDTPDLGGFTLSVVVGQEILHTDQNPADNLKKVSGLVTVIPVATEIPGMCSACHSWERLKNKPT